MHNAASAFALDSLAPMAKSVAKPPARLEPAVPEPIAVNVRLDPKTVEALDRRITERNSQGHHPKLNRAALVRELIEAAAKDW